MKSTKGTHHRTVYVAGIPPSVTSSTILAQQFRALNMGEVEMASLNPQFDELSRLVGGDRLTYKVHERLQLHEELESELLKLARTTLLVGKSYAIKHHGSIASFGGTVSIPSPQNTDFWDFFFSLRNFVIEESGKHKPPKTWIPLSPLSDNANSNILVSEESFQRFRQLNRPLEKIALKLIHLDKEIETVRREHPYKPSSSGFVTFKSPQSAHVVSQVLIHPAPLAYLTKMAPEPRDILWENISLRRGDRKWRQYLVESAVVGVTFFCVAPMGLIASVASITSLMQLFPNFIDWEKNIYLYNFFQTVLPNLLIIGFLTIVPYVFQCKEGYI
jgi:hypothetical protein